MSQTATKRFKNRLPKARGAIDQCSATIDLALDQMLAALFAHVPRRNQDVLEPGRRSYL